MNDYDLRSLIPILGRLLPPPDLAPYILQSNGIGGAISFLENTLFYMLLGIAIGSKYGPLPLLGWAAIGFPIVGLIEYKAIVNSESFARLIGWRKDGIEFPLPSLFVWIMYHAICFFLFGGLIGVIL